MIRLSLIKSNVTDIKIKRENLDDIYCVDKLYSNTFPLAYQFIEKYQRKDNELVAKLKCENYHTKYFCGDGIVTQLICRSDKKFIPQIIQNYAVKWYHTYLMHTGRDCADSTISQYYYCINIRDFIRTHIKILKKIR